MNFIYYRTSVSPISSGSRSHSTSSSKISSDNQNNIPVLASSSNITQDKIFQRKKDQEKTNLQQPLRNNDESNISERKKVDRIKEQLKQERNLNILTSSPTHYQKEDLESNDKARKVFPELPVSTCGGDKIEQHKDDFASTKRRLEEARARKMANIHRKKEIDK